MDTQKLPQNRGTETLDEDLEESHERKQQFYEKKLLILLLSIWILLHCIGFSIAYSFDVRVSILWNIISLISGIVFLIIIDYVSDKKQISKKMDICEDIAGIAMIISFITWVGYLIWHFLK